MLFIHNTRVPSSGRIEDPDLHQNGLSAIFILLDYRPGQPGARPSGDTRVSLAQTKPLASPSLGAKPLASSSLGAKSLASSSSGAKSINIPSHIGVGISPQVIYKILKIRIMKK